jgi:hypothetical protein
VNQAIKQRDRPFSAGTVRLKIVETPPVGSTANDHEASLKAILPSGEVKVKAAEVLVAVPLVQTEST